jgi:hypothetical protein
MIIRPNMIGADDNSAPMNMRSVKRVSYIFYPEK